MGCCASSPTNDAPSSRPSTHGPRSPVLIAATASTAARTAGSTGAAEGGGDAQAGVFERAGTQGRASGNIRDANLFSSCADRVASGINPKTSTLPTLPTLLSSEQNGADKRSRFDDLHDHNLNHSQSDNHHSTHRRGRNSPSRPPPNTPLRPAPPSSVIRCPVDVVNTSSPLSSSYATVLSSSITKGSNSFNNATRWTRTRLTHERNAFFDTRVTGAPEIWAAVRFVVELVRDGDLSTAQGVLDAAGCTCPTGELARGVYDERGRLYEVPDWVVGDPKDLVEAGDFYEEGEFESSFSSKEDGNEENGDEGSGNGSSSGSDSESESGNGKAKITTVKSERPETKRRNNNDKRLKKRLHDTASDGDKGRIAKVRVRLSDRAGDMEISIGANERVYVLVAKVHEKAKISTSAKIRIVYLGRVMLEQESLKAQGWCEGHVVNGLVFAA